MNVLVTGGAGFIGSHLVEKLLERGDQVTILDDFSAGRWENLDQVRYQIGIGVGSVTDLSTVRKCCLNKDVIFHLATQCLVKGNEDPLLIHSVNDVGTYNICLAAKENNCKIVYIGTSEEYGQQKTLPIQETASMNPVSLYGLTKLIGERYVKFFHDIYDVPAIVIRPFNTYGPRQREDAYAGVITSFIKRFEAGQVPIVFGDGHQRRDFSYVSDIVDGIILVSQMDGWKVVNLGSGTDFSIRDLADQISILWRGHRTNLEYEAARVNDVKRLRADISLAQSLGYSPKVSLYEGLVKYIEWYQHYRDRK